MLDADPLVFVAVTTTRTCVLASSGTSTYVVAVAPAMSANGLAPVERCH